MYICSINFKMLSRCTACRANLLRTARLKRQASIIQIRHQSSDEKIDIKELLSKPTWSVNETLLPSPEQLAAMNEVTPSQLHHLLRLSALPQPKSQMQENEMIETLHMQLHFVKQIQTVYTTGVEPLVAIRDETDAAKEETTIGLSDPAITEALKNEKIIGRNRRPRRNRDIPVDTKGAENWPVLQTAKKTVDGYFIVDSTDTRKAPEPRVSVFTQLVNEKQ